jgi:UbiD family decarboxylase
VFEDLRHFLDCLEERDLLSRVSKEVDPHLEIGTIMYEVHRRGGPAVLFENVKGCDYPLLSGALGTLERYTLALGLPNEPRLLQDKAMEAMRKPLPPVVVDQAPCQENVLQGAEVDISQFPAPFWHPLDGGQFIGTLGVVITQDPDSGARNAAVYREQVLGRDKTAVLLGRHGAVVLQKYLERGEPMPIATCFGVDPAVLAAAVMPLNYGEDELGMAGALRGSPVPLVRGKTVDLLVPANAEIVFEGYVTPDREAWQEEGPFGEYTGYYAGERFKKPTIQLTAITHRDRPIMHGTLEGRAPNESEVIAIFGTAIGLKADLIKMGVPGIKDVWGRGRSFISIISLDRQYYSGHVRQVINAALVAARGSKWIIVVDGDIDVFNWEQVDWALSTRVQPHRDIVVTDNWRTGVTLDPSIEPALRANWVDVRTSKIGIDATTQNKGFEWAPPVTPDATRLETVRAQWAQYGIDPG